MKIKFYLKIFKNVKKNKKKISGVLINKNKIEKVYFLYNSKIEKIFKNNFIKVNFYNKIYLVNIISTKYKNTKKTLQYFKISILNEFVKINTYSNKSDIIVKKYFKINFLFPRIIKLNIFFYKKTIRYKDFGLQYNCNKILIIKNNLTKN